MTSVDDASTIDGAAAECCAEEQLIVCLPPVDATGDPSRKITKKGRRTA